MDSITQKDPTRFVEHMINVWKPSAPSSQNSSQTDDQATSSSGANAALLEMKEFLNKSLTLINAKITAEAKKVVIDITEDQKGEIIKEFPDIQMLEPRGRFKVQITTTYVMIEGKAGNAMIPHDEIVNIALLPSHTSAKKEGEDYLALTFDHPLKVCGKDARHVLFNLSKALPKGCESGETESSRFVEALKEGSGMKINVPNPNIFRSVANQKTPHFLRCHKGTQEGAIYPMYCGVYFIKPTLFVHADEIAAISAGRGGSSGNTRFVDLHIETTDDRTLEFGNIEREELPAIQGYIRGYLELRRKKKEEKKSAEDGGKDVVNMTNDADDDDDNDDDDDDDYDPNKSDEEDVSGSGSADSSSDDSDNDDAPKTSKTKKTVSNKRPRKENKSTSESRKVAKVDTTNVKQEVIVIV